MAIDRSKSREEVARENKDREDEELYKKGKAVGEVLAGLGVTGLGLNKVADYLSKKPGAKPKPEAAMKLLKRGGIFLTTLGTPLVAYSSYKHYKLKNKDKDKKK